MDTHEPTNDADRPRPECAAAGTAGAGTRPAGAAPRMASSVTRHAQVSPDTPEWGFLVCGVDTLDLGLSVDWGKSWSWLQETLEAGKQEAAGTQGIWMSPSSIPCLMLPSGKAPMYRYHLETDFCHVWIGKSPESKGTPNVFVSIKAETLWDQGAPAAVRQIEEFVRNLGGRVRAVKPSRVDTCADFLIPSGLTDRLLRERLVGRSRETSQHLTGDQLETFYVGSRAGQIKARIYDKAKEVRAEGTKLWFLEVWGLDALRDVWRVEFQVRRPVLKQFGIDTFDDLLGHLGNLWHYLTSEWLTFREPDNANTSRRSVSDWWHEVQLAGQSLGEAFALQRRFGGTEASVGWYVGHIAGCLASYAARRGIPALDVAAGELLEAVGEYWESKDFEDVVEKKALKLGIKLPLRRKGGGDGPNVEG